MKYSFVLLVLLTVSAFAQGNFNIEWESPTCRYATLTQSETTNNIPEIVLEQPPYTKVFDGATKSLKYQYYNPDTSSFYWGTSLYGQFRLDVNHDGICEILVSHSNGTSYSFKVLNGATGGELYQESGNGYSSNTYIYDVDGDGYLEIILTSFVYQTTYEYKMRIISTTATPIGVEQNSKVAKDYKLGQNYPNPFNPATTIEYIITRDANVNLNIYNEVGQMVKNILEGNKKAGEYKIQLDCTDMASGVYFYEIVIDGTPEAKKMVLIK